jgi:hypothetical protein
MNETAATVRETLHAVAEEVPVPPLDEVALHRAVRRSGRRRTARVAGGVAAGAAVAAGLVLAVGAVRGVAPEPGEDGSRPPVAAEPEVVQTLRPSPLLTRPLYYVTDGRLLALTPDGTVHDLGVRSEAVVGSTGEGVLAVDGDSRLVWFDVRSSGRGDGRLTFARGTIPVEGAVESAALSGDGRYLAWLALDGRITVRDLTADEVVQDFEAADNSYVAAVSGRGVLVSEDGDLVLRDGEHALSVPTARDGYGWQSDVAGDLVSVMDRDGVTRVYDVSSGSTAELVVEIPGSGRLAPDGAAVVTAHLGGPAVRLWVDDGLVPLAALDAGRMGESVAWLDDGHAVVTSRSAAGTVVHVCEIASRSCDEVLTSEADVTLAE